MTDTHTAMQEAGKGSRAIPRLAAWIICGAAVALIAAGTWFAMRPVERDAIDQSASAATLMELGSSIRSDIGRVVHPAIERTRMIAVDSAVIAALRSRDAARQTDACNKAIQASTEIDAIALFDTAGNIAAINTVYASGEVIQPERVARIMGLSFAGRDIIQHCVQNHSDEQVLEFQTECDITPALFDSSGLSVAFSVPVRDPETREKLGVVSVRLRFERLTEIINAMTLDGQHCSIEFVTDHGEYFSEDIVAGRAEPPVSPVVLAGLVAPLVGGGIDCSLTRSGGDYLSLFRLEDFVTLDGGGIQVLLRADSDWLTREARQARLLRAGGIIAAGIVLLLLCSLIRSLSMARVSERKAVIETFNAQRALAELSTHKAALDQHAIVSVMDASGRLIEVNEACRRMSGADASELAGADFRVLTSEVHDDAFWKGVWDEIASGRTWQGEICNRARDGSLYWVQSTIVPFRDVSGEITRYVCIGADITERKRAEADRERANRAEAANHAKSEFLANMSHEIRTPLNGVVGLLDLLLGTDLNADQRRYGKLARTSASLLTSVLGDILDLSKIEAGRLEMSPCDFNLHDTVEEVMAMMAQPAVRKGLEIACHIEPEVPVVVRADAERLRQIIVNLVNNAIKFTEQGGVVLRLSAESQSGSTAAVRITVTDTGIGVPQDRLHRLFKPFSQADASTTRVYGGTGLGLAISKQIVELMGGTIGVESEPGRGSTFWFTIRCDLPERAAEPPAAAPFDPRGLRVLAVDDSVMQRDVLSQQIGAWGMEVEAATDGEDALRMLVESAASKPFRIAIIDRDMPRMDGFDLAHAIRSNSDLRDTALMLVLAPDDEIDPHRLAEMGFSGHMSKPIKQSCLFDAIMSTIAAAEQRPSVMRRPEQRMKHTPAAGSTSAPKLRILVAEDNEVNQIVVSEILTKAGHSCDVVPNGRQIVERLHQERYDLVLMDCQMPVMDGFEATKMIRRQEAASPIRRHMPIIALTANAMKGDREHCLDIGMDGYVSKPIDPKELLRTIAEVAAKRGTSARAA